MRWEWGEGRQKMTPRAMIAAAGEVESRILLIRGKKVMLDRDLAELYGVTTKRLNEQVKRNRERFPEDVMFLLSWEEVRAVDRKSLLLVFA